MSRYGTLWMGDLEPYMDENFVCRSFSELGEEVLNVKLIRNKQTGIPQGYCFVEFKSDEAAQRAMLRLNGKIVPGTVPPKRYKLNRASYGKEHLLTPEFSLFIGDLSEDVDDLGLYNAFQKYKSCITAKVVLDNDGQSKGYGFVRFSDEVDQHRAMSEMQNQRGIGRKPLRVSLATPKRAQYRGSSHGSGNYDQYYNQYSQQYQNYYGSWTGYNQQQQQPQQPGSQYYGGYGGDQYGGNTSANYEEGSQQQYDQFDDLEVLEDPNEEFDIDELNEIHMRESEDLFEALEASRWQPLDNVMSQVEPVAS